MAWSQIPRAFEFLYDQHADDGGPVRYRAAYGGRGGGKTHSFARALLVRSTKKPYRIGVYREIQRSIRDSIKRTLEDRITQLEAEDPSLRGFFTPTETEIRTAIGGLFIFGGLRTNVDAVKSTEGLDIACVVEAHKVAQRSWDILKPTVRAEGSEIWAEWNPENETDPVDAMFRGPGGPPPGSIVRAVNCEHNPFLSEVLRREMEHDRRRDPDRYQWVWRGGYRRASEARVFRNWTEEAFDTPSNAAVRLGADWGFAVDPTVLVRCFIGRFEDGTAIADESGRHLFVDHEAYMVGCEIDQTPALFDTVPEARRRLITADSARPETVSYLQRQGFRIVPALKGPGSVEDGVEFLKSFDIVVHPRCRHVIAELSLYSFRTDPLTGLVTSELEDRANNTIDALRYACEGVRRARRARPPRERAQGAPEAPPRGELAWMQ